MVYDDDYLWRPPVLIPGSVYVNAYYSTNYMLLIEVADLELYPFAASAVAREYTTRNTFLDSPEEIVCLL